MRVILDLDEIVLGKLQFRADAEKRSRKNYMEMVLQNVAKENLIEKMIPIVEKQTETLAKINTLIEKEKQTKGKAETSDFWKERMKKKLGI